MIFSVTLAVLLGLTQSSLCCHEPCESSTSPFPKCCPDMIAKIEEVWACNGKPDISPMEANSPYWMPKSTLELTSNLGLTGIPKCIFTSYTSTDVTCDVLYEDGTSAEFYTEIIVDECDPIHRSTDGKKVSYYIAELSGCYVKYTCSPDGEEGDAYQGSIRCSKGSCYDCATVEALYDIGKQLDLCLDLSYSEECRTCTC